MTDAASADPVPLANAYRHSLWSEDIGQQFTIDVAPPSGFEGKKLPVLYITDGAELFPLITHIHRIMRLPPVLIVGISYPDATKLEWLQRRARDLTPTYSQDDLQKFSWPQPGKYRPGGANRFAAGRLIAILP